MWAWLSRLLGRESQAAGSSADEPLLKAEREVQELRLVVQEHEAQTETLRAELQRARAGEAARLSDAVEERVERLLASVSAPVAQLTTQAHLLEAEGKPVEARDVLAIAKRLVGALVDAGLTLEGVVGESASFDPDRDELLSGSAPPPGDSVIVRFPGCSYRGRMLKKTGVEGLSGERD